MSDTVVTTKHLQECQVEPEPVPEEQYRVAELVVFDDCKRGIGIKICGGCSLDGEELYGVFIRRILPGGLAETQGGLQRGDQILEVNGDSLEGVTNDRAASILRLACFTNHVEMVVCRDEQALAMFHEVMNRKTSQSSAGTPAFIPETQAQTDTEPSSPGSGQLSPNNDNLTAEQQESLLTPTEAQGAEYNGVGVTPKLTWRDLSPKMSSTPHTRGIITVQTAVSGPRGRDVELSPVGEPILSLANALSNSSMFNNHSASQDHVSSQDPTFTRKLSIGPYQRVEVDKLTSALSYLGLETTPEKDRQMRSRLNIDANGTVLYGDVVEVIRDVYRFELETTSMGATGTTTAQLQPPAYTSQVHSGASGSIPHHAEIEIEELRLENERLKVLLEEKEDEVDLIRKEQREMKTKVNLAAKAQKVARDMEHDYEEVVRLLETEIAQLKLQLNRQVENDPVTQRRLAMLTCQLRKAEGEKRTLRVANEQLLQFAEAAHDTLSHSINAATSRPLIGSKPSSLLGNKHKQTTKAAKVIINRAQEVVKSVRTLIDSQPLPFGWEENYTADGVKYYVNHLNQVTTWSHPLSNVSHLPTSDQPNPELPTNNTEEIQPSDESDPKQSSS